ncbi:MAG: preprotein translocase subunit SecE [Oscillospiraceae bacterium]|nr:preprotein translocase subunit SecE [Oscillospiraceae bacterium]MBR4928347.1 preprotein translocase subunit SecE [Oscillospiraceae bacterium]MBR5070978.1 preprotein translocase subunit SecE [Oscillospiraceae bacterium]
MADKKADKKKPGFFARIGKYFRDAKGEFKKIVWPSRKQIWNNVAVVLVMVVIFAIATWGLDLLFAFLRDLLLKQF